MTDPAAPQRAQTPSNSLGYDSSRRGRTVKLILAILPGVISGLMAYTGSAGEARDQAAVVKDKAANVYQRTRESVGDLQERVVELTDRIAALERAVRLARTPRTSPRTTAAAVSPPAAPAPAPAPAPLPATFDQAAAAPVPPTPEAKP